MSRLFNKAPAEIVRKKGRLYVFRYRKYLRRLRARRALLAYLPDPVAAELRGETITRFSNSGLGIAWARCLNELGYEVDIIGWDDTDFEPRHNYGLIVFHGGRNFTKISQSFRGQPSFIHFSTGSYWRFNNDAEDKRIARFHKRHGIKLEHDRYITAGEDPVNEAAEAIIVLGDPSMAATFPEPFRSKVLTINNASYPDSHFDTITKNYAEARHNFLFFAGSGNVHKGLDLVIEVFRDLPALNLYIVTIPEPIFLKVYAEDLKKPNIHLVGEVNMRSREFYEVMDKCAFVVLPSCSEGQAGSVVEAMNQGLIPIVSKETRLNASDYGKVLDTTTAASLKAAVREMAALSPTAVEKLARRTRETAINEHSPEQFRTQLKEYLRQTLSNS